MGVVVVPAFALLVLVLAAAGIIGVALDVSIVRVALRGAPQPHWAAIYQVLESEAIVSKAALRVGAWLTPPAATAAHRPSLG